MHTRAKFQHLAKWLLKEKMMVLKQNISLYNPMERTIKAEPDQSV